jgi:acyl-CoA thioesterase
VLDPDDFRLDPVDGGFARELPARWCFGDRAFGGYTAALALGALLTVGPHRTAASLAVTFLEAGVAGPVAVTVEPLRAGRRTSLARARIHQDGRPILEATAWLLDAWTDAPHVVAPVPALAALAADGTGTGPDGGSVATDAVVAAGPSAGAPVTWLSDHWPALRYAERRGIDYPTSWAGFARGRPAVSLWARMVPPPDHDGDPLPFAQLADVLHFDGHLFDAPGQVTGFDQADIVSLDLSIAWQPGAPRLPSTAWRLLDARGSVAEGAATSFATARDEGGALLAVATSQGLVLRG